MPSPNVTAPEALRRAMQVVVDAWYSALTPSFDGSVEESNLHRLIDDALAKVSCWTCVQWGIEAGWWLAPTAAPDESRCLGLRRLEARFEACSSPRVGAAAAPRDQLDASVAAEVWHWVTIVCSSARSEQTPSETPGLDLGFAAIISAFENAMQVKGDLRDGRVELSIGKANTDHARRRSGSYYTPRRIAQLVLERTLGVALSERVATGGEFERPFRVIDPACGAGLFLVEAARRITAHRLASLTVRDDATEFARLFAKTVRENIFGIDLNPLAIEWCRLWLWSCAGNPELELDTFAPGLRVGNAIFGAPPDYWKGSPPEAWRPTDADDRARATVLKRAHLDEKRSHEPQGSPSSEAARRVMADGWCAAFLWPKVASYNPEHLFSSDAPTFGRLSDAAARVGDDSTLVRAVRALAVQHKMLHWTIEFDEVFAEGGFDVVIGNPPWIAHAGRASQGIEPRLKNYFVSHYASFNGYPTTHGLFVERASSILCPGGRMGFVLPSSVSELGGYEATRRAHDQLCDFEDELVDFGEGCFPGVTQPCMALVSRRSEAGRTRGACGDPWPVQRDDLNELGRALLARLAALPVLDADLFGERGVQSDARMKPHMSAGVESHDRFTTPLREGADIREFFLGAPRLWADWPALGRLARPVLDYGLVRFVVRQTASYPIATLSDGLPFRNSLLAGFSSPRWAPEVVVALLNSSLLRWHHYMRHRDARQPVLPQVKIGHLRAVPRPIVSKAASEERLAELTRCFQGAELVQDEQRLELDELVFDLYESTDAERALVGEWVQRVVRRPKRRG